MKDNRKQYLVGIQNSAGEEYFHCWDEAKAHNIIKDFLDDGNCESDIVVYQAIPVKTNIDSYRTYDITFTED